MRAGADPARSRHGCHDDTLADDLAASSSVSTCTLFTLVAHLVRGGETLVRRENSDSGDAPNCHSCIAHFAWTIPNRYAPITSL
jgi:hypothetical protein